MGKRFYITTAIDYTNGAPHLGHAYEKVVTDVIARAHRAMGEEVFFVTGLDEHGQKVQQAAAAEGKDPMTYCDELALQWLALAKDLGLSNDDFIRTTEARHKAVVHAILSKLHASGDLYSQPYQGWYSVKEETFLTEKDRNPNGSWDPKWGQVIPLTEENWYFRMARHQDWLVAHIEANPSFIAPACRRNEVLGFLRSEKLADLCISRPASRLSWGIPLPFAPDWVTYVWFDALTNYVTVAADHGDPAVLHPLGLPAPASPMAQPPLALWPADIHVIGKDIIKFHAVYWPIMLHAAGLPLPLQILTHGWWQKDGQKLSKSTGNVVDPIAVIRDWGLDAFRYYVLRELAIGPDGNWTDEGFLSRYNAELANGLGNLLNRAVNMLNKYRDGIVPAPSDELAPDASRAVENTSQLLRQNDLQGALVAIWDLVSRANLYVEQTQPFKLAKDSAQAPRLDQVLYNLVESCRILAILLAPFLPDTSRRILGQLGIPAPAHPHVWPLTAWGGLQRGHKVAAPQPLFPRKDLKPMA